MTHSFALLVLQLVARLANGFLHRNRPRHLPSPPARLSVQHLFVARFRGTDFGLQTCR
jgi:hypothetical protein